MTFHRLLVLAIGLEITLVGATAHSSYVVEADGVNVDSGVVVTGVDFDFVAHDFGMEPKDAIQILLDNLSSASNLRGNLLSWSSSEDYSNYDDDDAADAEQDLHIFGANAVRGVTGTVPFVISESLPADIMNFSPLDINAMFWTLGPTGFTSFSQLTAARFGFDQSP